MGRRTGWVAVALCCALAGPTVAQDLLDSGAALSGNTEIADLLRDLAVPVTRTDGTTALVLVPCGEPGARPCAPDPRVRLLQDTLAALGLDPGPADGVLGPATVQALARYLAATDWRLTAPALPGTRHGLVLMSPDSWPPVPGTIGTSSTPMSENPGGSLLAAQPGTDLPSLADIAAPVPTRAFAGPDQFPPSGFRGYGFLAFPAPATGFDYDRHMLICQAYVSSLPTPAEVEAPPADQFVTVWPVLAAEQADIMNQPVHRSNVDALCGQAIDGYDANRARDVIAMVHTVNQTDLEGRGPFLFGWIPATGYGAPGRLILMLDLSRVTTYEQALTQMQSWRQKIETNPDLLRDGYSVENLRRVVRDWADLHGQAFLLLIGRE